MPRLSFLLLTSILLAGCQNKQERLTTEIKQLGGHYTVDEQKTDKPLLIVNLGFSSADDAVLERLKGQTQLQELILWNTGVTDVGLAHVEGLTQLQKLDLSGTAVTDAGLKHLRPLAQLKELNLRTTKVTAAALADLRKALPKTKIQR